MKAVRVQYTVRAEYAEQNRKNIQRVMDSLKENPINGMKYSTYTDHDDPNTFIHINMAPDSTTIAKLNDLQEFKDFRQALKESQPVSPPNRMDLELVAAGFEF
ncbi:MAG: hypothetical protein ACR2MT_08940 [Aurantibacter sp.]